MYHFFLNKGIELNKLINLNNLDKAFYIASMEITLEDEDNKLSLFLPKKR